VLYFFWRSPRIGSEKFYGGVLTHDGRGDNRVYREISQIGEEMKLLAPVLKGTKVVAEAAILYSHANAWALQFPMQPNRHFKQREHGMLFYTALHDRNVPVDFVPTPQTDEDSAALARYKIVIAPSLHLLAGGEADRLKLYVQEGGTLVGTFNTGLVDEHNTAPDSGYPHDLTDLFGLEVQEFDAIAPETENHIVFKGPFPASHLYSARLWCDIIDPRECEVLATYSQDFYGGRPAMTMNQFGLGRAIYLGTMFPQPFYHDLVGWLRQLCNLVPVLKVPENVELSLREKDGVRIYFLLNHHSTPVRVHFAQPMHDYLTGSALSGNYDLPPHGVLVLDERVGQAAPAG
jgi:beta-galactosidase